MFLYDALTYSGQGIKSGIDAVRISLGGVQGITWSLGQEALRKNVEILGTNTRYYAVLLLDCGQDHLFENWDEPGTRDEDKLAFLKQARCYTPPTLAA